MHRRPRRADPLTALVSTLGESDEGGDQTPLAITSAVVGAAVRHGIEGWVHRRARLDGVASTRLTHAAHAATARHLRAVADLALIDGALGRADVPYLVVKGPALVRLHGDDSALRSYIDVDILVPRTDVLAAVAGLEEAGFRLVDANWPLLARASVHELRIMSPAGGAVDLHWALGPGPVEGDLSPPFARLASRSRELKLPDVTCRTLGAADTVVHLCVHAAAAGGHRLLWLADIRAAVKDARSTLGPRADQALADCAADWHARPAVALMVGRSRRVLGGAAERPMHFARQPSGWRLWTTVVDRFSPPVRWDAGPSVSRLMAKSCRAGTMSSLSAAVGKCWAWWSTGREAPPTPDALLDPENPSSALYPVGGRDAALAFMADVSATHRGPG